MVYQEGNEEPAFDPYKSIQTVKHSTFLGEMDRLYVIRKCVTVQEGMMNATKAAERHREGGLQRRNANPIKALNDI